MTPKFNYLFFNQSEKLLVLFNQLVMTTLGFSFYKKKKSELMWLTVTNE